MTTTSNSKPNKLLSEQELELTLQKAKVQLFAKKGAGFLGSLLCNHEIFFDETAPTAWCNGKSIGIGPAFWSILTKETRVTLLAHELWHTGFEHMSRVGNRDPEIWNQAGDYVINNMLKKNGFVFDDMGGLLDERFNDMTTEAVYAVLEQEQPPSGGSSGGIGLPMPGEASNQGQEGKPDIQGDLRDPGGDKAKADISRKNVQAIQASQMSKEAGVIPGEIKEIIDEFLNPVLPWNRILHRYFSDLSNDDYSWRRPSRRYTDEYLPSLMGENGLEHLVYYLDVSGSISSGELQRFHSEVRYIHQELRPKRLTLVTFDKKIQQVFELEQDDVYENFEIIGRGGTDLSPVHDHIVENHPTAAVIFSDMYVPKMKANPGVPVIWIIMDNKHAETDFGTRIHLSKKDLKQK